MLPIRLAEYHPVLSELCKAGRNSHAESLAWTAIEAVSSRTSPVETLVVAGPFLQGIGDSKELRAQVAKLFRESYGEVEGLETLLISAGIEGGRPVRRALRTLDVALSVKEGDYLRSREDDLVAKINAIDRATWHFTVDMGDDTETMEAVILADRYRRVPPDDLHVLQQFAPDQLKKRLRDDAAGILVSICRENGGKVDSIQLEGIMSPAILTEAEFSKWWTAARTAAKKSPNLKIEGRSPYVIQYVNAPASAEEAIREEFDACRDAISQFGVIDRYLRDCKAGKKDPDKALVQYAHDRLVERAKKMHKEHVSQAGVIGIMLRRMNDFTPIENAVEKSRDWFRDISHPEKMVAELKGDALIDAALATWSEVRTDTWIAEFLKALPGWPMEACELASRRLVAAGVTPAQFEPVIQEIFASPIKHFEALLWLYDGPSKIEKISNLPAVNLLMRVIRVLEECRRDDRLSKDIVKNIQACAKSVLGARRFDRFSASLDGLDHGMATAIRTQLNRLELLGRSVRDDMIRIIKERFPVAISTPAVMPWSREDVIYVTSEGLARKQQEVEHHVNVKMRDNARAIGAAAELGDLSENSEYKFALEERDLLQARLAQMNGELNKARVMSVDDVPTDHVGIGTRAVLKRTTDGVLYEITFVGPWDADSEHRWFNYKAPFAEKVLGKKIGDVIDFDHAGATGSYEIVELHNGVAH